MTIDLKKILKRSKRMEMYVTLHSTEFTAVEATKRVVSQVEGALYEKKDGRFSVEGSDFTFFALGQQGYVKSVDEPVPFTETEQCTRERYGSGPTAEDRAEAALAVTVTRDDIAKMEATLDEANPIPPMIEVRADVLLPMLVLMRQFFKSISATLPRNYAGGVTLELNEKFGAEEFNTLMSLNNTVGTELMDDMNGFEKERRLAGRKR